MVVVITDGGNTTRKSTYDAAQELREDDARLVWLYVTQGSTPAMGREKLQMAEAGDVTYEVATWANLGPEHARLILAAVCGGERLTDRPTDRLTG